MKAVIFDVGNVLINWDVYALYRTMLPDDEAIATFLDESGLLVENIEFDRGKPFATGVAELSEQFPHHAPLFRAFDERWIETVAGEISGSVQILAELKEKDVPLYAITNFSLEKWKLAFDRFPFLRDCFRDIVVSGEEHLVKPDQEIFRLALSRNNLIAGDCVFIDDSPANVETARQIGIDAILFTSPEALRDALMDRAVL